MENEPELIRDQMQETRTALTEKLEALEQQVVNTVQNITTPVTETVETVKKTVEETVCAVKDTVQSTVDTVTGAAQKTAETVKETFNLPRQVERHPWLAMLGAVAVGYIGGRLLLPEDTGSRGEPTTSGSPFPESMNRAVSEPHEHNGRHGKDTEEPSEGLLSGLMDAYSDELNQLKALGIGAVVGVVRDLVTQNVSGEIGSRLKDWMNGLTEKMGGKPFSEPIVPSSPEQPVSPSTHFASSGPSGPAGHSDLGTRARL
jgi:ElaB/YqjD/DUF883 family membrane-anchored ribosome-binding protein